MSDSEDNAMDVDTNDATTESMAFSARSTEKKGKSSAANLPVEALDVLPWVEKFRPASLDDVYGHTEILATINKFVDANRLPHLLLYGPPGTGKTSTILALARRIYGEKNMRQMVLELNASDDRGIDVVREQIKTFSSTKQIFSAFSSNTTNGSSGGSQSKLAGYKLIILDEADAMTSAAQMALRRIMEKYTPNTRFCVIANYSHKLSPALLSRCTRFRFSPLPDTAIRSLSEHVISKEDVRISPPAIDALVKMSKGDCRRALNVLQACHASTLPLPDPAAEPVHGQPFTPEAWASRDTITPGLIYDCVAAPHPEDIANISQTLLSTSDVASCLNTIKQLRVHRGLALADLIEGLAEELGRLEVSPEVRIKWCEGLAEVESRMAGGGSETVQVGGLVGVVRRGCELMDK